MNLHNNEAGRKVEWHQSHWHRGRTAWAESLQQPMATLDRLMSPGTSVGQGLVAGGGGGEQVLYSSVSGLVHTYPCGPSPVSGSGTSRSGIWTLTFTHTPMTPFDSLIFQGLWRFSTAPIRSPVTHSNAS